MVSCLHSTNSRNGVMFTFNKFQEWCHVYLPQIPGMVSWLENPTEESVKEPEAAETTWADEDDSPVEHLTTDTFKTFLAEHASVLVMFYNIPIHCIFR
ncbi:hypothetical protein ACHWQZ_G014900 [Mnemiopsis leidyi]